MEQMRHVELERWQTFRLMLEKEQRYVEVLKKELHRSSSDVSNGDNYKLKRELNGAERRVKTLQDQLTTFNEIPVLYINCFLIVMCNIMGLLYIFKYKVA